MKLDQIIHRLGLSRQARETKRSRVTTHVEYWVYLPAVDMPDQVEISKYLYDHRLIGVEEGRYFTDIRLSLVLVARDKNPRLFRPDIFSESLGATPGKLAEVERSQALARITFISEEPVDNFAYLRLVVRMAEAIVSLANGLAVFDLCQQKLYALDEFAGVTHGDIASLESNVRFVWADSRLQDTARFTVTTLGMIKRGVAELQSAEVLSDAQLLTTTLLEKLAFRNWTEPAFLAQANPELQAEYYDTMYTLRVEPKRRDGRHLVRIFRHGEKFYA